MRVRLRSAATAAVCSICVAAASAVPVVYSADGGAKGAPIQANSTQAYVLTSTDAPLASALGGLATLPGVSGAQATPAVTAAATAQDPVLFPFQAAYTLVSKGFLGYTSGAPLTGETGAPAAGTITPYALLAAPFVMVNAPWQALTGQSIVLPDGGKLAGNTANLLVAEQAAFSAFTGLPSQLSTVISTLAGQAQATYGANALSTLTGASALASKTALVSAPNTTGSVKSLAVTNAAPAPADPVLFPFQAAYTLASKGFLGYTTTAANAGPGSPAVGTITPFALLSAPFVAVNAPWQALTGQSIVLPDGGKLTPSVANLVLAEQAAFSAFTGLPSQLSTVISTLAAQAQATYGANALSTLTGASALAPKTSVKSALKAGSPVTDVTAPDVVTTDAKAADAKAGSNKKSTDSKNNGTKNDGTKTDTKLNDDAKKSTDDAKLNDNGKKSNDDTKNNGTKSNDTKNNGTKNDSTKNNGTKNDSTKSTDGTKSTEGTKSNDSKSTGTNTSTGKSGVTGGSPSTGSNTHSGPSTNDHSSSSGHSGPSTGGSSSSSSHSSSSSSSHSSSSGSHSSK